MWRLTFALTASVRTTATERLRPSHLPRREVRMPMHRAAQLETARPDPASRSVPPGRSAGKVPSCPCQCKVPLRDRCAASTQESTVTQRGKTEQARRLKAGRITDPRSPLYASVTSELYTSTRSCRRQWWRTREQVLMCASDVHAWQGIAHLILTITSFPRVSVPELTISICSPALHRAVVEERARVPKA